MEFIDTVGPKIKTTFVEDRDEKPHLICCFNDCQGMSNGYPHFCKLGFASGVGKEYPTKGFLIPGDRCPGIKHPGKEVQCRIVEIEEVVSEGE